MSSDANVGPVTQTSWSLLFDTQGRGLDEYSFRKATFYAVSRIDVYVPENIVRRPNSDWATMYIGNIAGSHIHMT